MKLADMTFDGRYSLTADEVAATIQVIKPIN